MKTLWNILRALINAPDAIHWIRKYDSCKKEYQDLEQQMQQLSVENLNLREKLDKQ